MGVLDVRQVFGVHPNQEGVFRALQPMPPFLQGQLHRQQFPVSHAIVALSRGQAAGEEGARVELVVSGGAMGQGGADTHIQGIHLHHKLKRGVRVGEDGGGGERFLQRPLETRRRGLRRR